MSRLKVLLDLDSTMIYAIFDPNDIDNILNHPRYQQIKDRIFVCTLVDSLDDSIFGTGSLTRVMFILRPHARTFLKFLDDNVDTIGIWTAGNFRYARAIEYYLFPPDAVHKSKYQYEFYTREHCDIMSDSDGCTVLKEFKARNIDLTTSIIIDDRPDTFSKNLENGILIPRYEPEHIFEDIIRDDRSLLELIDWFKRSGILSCKDVRTVNKTRIFSSFT